ncbi:MAG TPA: stimulus-sensing domain-containing protein [Aliidongia sp.]|uniref:stimulus-sensing domain-containing protein n=1 Tax=Aliidongia sp. TaxID=1914230 RepID=UPI002DDD4DE3|nr:stimulus-sensing domain-containing protein [Aliidongia sp.]HEV2678148.1 stimulus-sensing domain-containing protein [Aliidongia sp.]
MALVTDIKKPDGAASSLSGRNEAAHGVRRLLARPRKFGQFSLSRRMLAVNVLAVALLGGGMLYLDRYETGLIDTELQALATQGGIFAGALSEGATLEDLGDQPVLVPSLGQGLMRRLVEPTRIRARLFLPTGAMIADSRTMQGRGGAIQIQELAPPDDAGPGLLRRAVDWVSNLLRRHDHHPAYVEHVHATAADYDEVGDALEGHITRKVRSDLDGGLVLSAAVPVKRYKQVLGAVMLQVGGASLEQKVNSVRADILRLFMIVLAVTVALSLYLAGTIARPVRKLAQAAYEIRHGDGRKVDIPDFSHRHDEIGELSVALTAMTAAIFRRMDAIERFAADVAHEIKNPLTSLRSAVETATRVQDPKQQKRLMAIIQDDVTRLDRLISDISDASRLDAEMSRLERSPVSLAGMLGTLVDVQSTTRDENDPILEYHPLDEGERLMVLGKEGRLVQVFRNLIGNAASFSPPGGRILVRAERQGQEILLSVEDEGPGVPDGKLAAIFDRFYSERPVGEKFGTHSGLGLSISKQIVEAHGGTIWAENRRDDAGQVQGARFCLRLPAAR